MILRSLLKVPRATTVDMTRNQGKDEAEIIVRAASKAGAIITARANALSIMPVREQKIEYVEQMDSDRLLNKWKVRVKDQDSMANLTS
jgi:hypothetical protein